MWSRPYVDTSISSFWPGLKKCNSEWYKLKLLKQVLMSCECSLIMRQTYSIHLNILYTICQLLLTNYINRLICSLRFSLFPSLGHTHTHLHLSSHNGLPRPSSLFLSLRFRFHSSRWVMKAERETRSMEKYGIWFEYFPGLETYGKKKIGYGKIFVFPDYCPSFVF